MNTTSRTVAATAILITAGGLALTIGAGAGTWAQWEGALEEKTRENSSMVQLGKQIYMQACFYCHGDQGRGDGRGGDYLITRPRDFTAGKFKVRTTPSGQLPLEEDLFRTISVGYPAYGMPSFQHLTPEERWSLVYYIKTFYPPFESEKPEPIQIGEPPPVSASLLSQGRDLFRDAECWKCHGMEGKGDGPSAPDLKDDWGNPVRLLDWTEGERAFKRGARARDLMYTFMTGFAGTPMPSYAGALSNEQAWALAYHVEQMTNAEQADHEKE